MFDYFDKILILKLFMKIIMILIYMQINNNNKYISISILYQIMANPYKPIVVLLGLLLVITYSAPT